VPTHNRDKQNCPVAGHFAANNSGDVTAFGPDMRITAMADRPGGVATAKIVSKDVIGTRFLKFKINVTIVVKRNPVHNKSSFSTLARYTGCSLR
jgi:hypothetical protein